MKFQRKLTMIATMRSSKFVSLVAACLIATGAHAQQAEKSSAPSITVGGVEFMPWGTFDLFLGNVTGFQDDASPGVSPAQSSKVQVYNGGLTTSFIGLKAHRPISDTLSATFELASFINPNDATTGRSSGTTTTIAGATFGADPLFPREANFGLADSTVGSIRVGTSITPFTRAAFRSNAFGDSMVFGPFTTLLFINSGLSGGTNWERSVILETARFGGFSVHATYAFGDNGSVYVNPASANNAPGRAGNNFGASLTYANGPFQAVLAGQKVNRNSIIGEFNTSGLSVDTTEAAFLGLVYDLGPVKLFAHGAEIRDEASATSPFYAAHQRILDLSAKIPLGQGDVLLGYGNRAPSGSFALTPNAAIDFDNAPGGNGGRSIATGGYVYHLFKNTDIYALLSQDSTKTTVVNVTNAPGTVTKVTTNATDYGVGGKFSF